MVHDPISFLKRGTYIEPFQLVIPRDNGKIDGAEISTGKFKEFLVDDGERLKVDLYYT